jgi:RHS repeat-associated protein
MNSSIEVSMKRYRFCGKERDEETGLYYFGARFYAPWICRFCCCDIMQFKYSELTPYNYCANNPVKFIDLDGMEVKLKTHYKKDASGNDTKQVERYELNITGKVINMSGKDIDMDKAAKEIISQIESSFKGETDKGIPITTNANFTVAESMKDVTPSDHLIVFANMTDGGTGKTPNGVACDYGGKVAFVGASFFNFRKDRIAAHEMGHLLGLKHTSSGLMRSDYLGSKVSSSELGSIIRNCKASTAFPLLNKGPNRSGKMPYTGQVGQYVNMKLYKK